MTFSTFPTFGDPSLPKLVEHPPSGESWIHEIKHDGYRLAVRRDDDRVSLMTRKGLDWTSRFPLVAAAARELPRSCYLDGEVVIEGADGISDWPALHACASAGRCPEAIFWAFDLLLLDGRDLRKLPLGERKDLLAGLLAKQIHSGGIRYIEHLGGVGGAIFASACGLGLEGIVSKRVDSPYRSGKTDSWRKCKCGQRGDFIVAGFIPNSGYTGAVGALVLAERNGNSLVLSGRVGSGWSMKKAIELSQALQLITQDNPPLPAVPKTRSYRDVIWVRPIVTVEIAYRERTGDGLLRHPSFKGIVGVSSGAQDHSA